MARADLTRRPDDSTAWRNAYHQLLALGCHWVPGVARSAIQIVRQSFAARVRAPPDINDIRSMASRISKLTKRSVDALKANAADTVYWDSELTGFGVRKSSGAKTY